MVGKVFTLLLASVFPLFVQIAEAQQPKKVWRIGLMHVGLDHVPPSLEPLREGLKVLRYEEDKNIRLDWRNLLDEAAATATAQEFVRDRVDLIVAWENQSVRAVKAATSEIPVVILHVTDPVAAGFVKSLSHPGGNLTGIVGFRDLWGKQMELFKELVPRLHQVLTLIDPQDPATQRALAEVRDAAMILKLKLLEREVTTQTDIERLFGSVKRGDVDGIFIVSPNIQTNFSSLVIRLGSGKRLPVPSHRKEWVERGALFSYGPNYVAVGRAAAVYVDKILKGAKPADLPVEQASQIELVINLKTAKQIGLTIPPNVLARADKVIK
jgi:putative tryptophan/tyrosine transport system substrate-binding protein